MANYQIKIVLRPELVLYCISIIIIIIFIPSVSRIPRDLETEKLEIENVRSDT